MTSNHKISALLDDIRLTHPEHYPLIDKLRILILGLDPSITEEVKYGGFLFSRGHAFCGIFSYRQHVSLEFGEGAKLSDTSEVLEGSGKLRRHIKLRTLNDLTDKQVAFYLRAALDACAH